MNELLLNEINHGNLSCEDARKMYEMIEREEIIKSYTFPTKPSSDGYYHIYVKDSTVKSGRRQFKSKTLGDLKEKDIESICMKNLKRYDLRKKAFARLRGILKSVFDLAFSEYWITDNIYTRVNFHKFSDMIVDDVPPRTELLQIWRYMEFTEGYVTNLES